MLVSRVELLPDLALHQLVAQVLVHGRSLEEILQDSGDLHPMRGAWGVVVHGGGGNAWGGVGLGMRGSRMYIGP